MRMFIATLLAAIALSAQAFPVTANLVGSHLGTSVGGTQIRICVYAYNGHNYEQPIPALQSCPLSIQLQ